MCHWNAVSAVVHNNRRSLERFCFHAVFLFEYPLQRGNNQSPPRCVTVHIYTTSTRVQTSSTSMTAPQHVTVTYRGKERYIAVDPASTTLAQFCTALDKEVPGLAPHTLKLIISKPKSITIQLSKEPDTLLSTAGVLPGCRALLLGSYQSELQQLAANKAAEAALRLPSFEHEATRASQRRRGALSTASLAAAATAAGRFSSFQVLPLPPGAPASAPAPSAALTLLHRLAADPAITAVMASHSWTVGVLSEMPPEGKVGVSAVCVLGYNVNKGQEVSLRLRTDDYKGFRKYLRIQETLVHELAHMVHSEHDASFKALNSQLLREVAQHEAAATAGGRTLAGSNVFNDDEHWLGDIAADTGHSSGRTLGTGSSSSSSSVQALHDARMAAAAAALSRQQQQEQSVQPEQLELGTLNHDMATSSAAVAAAVAAAGGAGLTEAVDIDEAEDAADTFTDDPATAAAEQKMRRLGSFEPPHNTEQQRHVLGQNEGGSDEMQWEAQGNVGQQQQLVVQEQQQQQQQQRFVTVQQQQQQQQRFVTVQQQQQLKDMADQTMQDEHNDENVSVTETLASHSISFAHRPASPPVAAASPAGSEAAPALTAATAAATVPAPIGTDEVPQAEGSTAAEQYTGVSADDVVMQKVQQAQQLLQQLLQQAGSDCLMAVQAVGGVLNSLLEHPSELKYQKLRCGNVAFNRKLGQYPAAVKLLLLAGFTQQMLVWPQQQAQVLQHSSSTGKGEPEPVFVYARRDPGLLWLILSLVRDAESNLLRGC